MNANRNGIARVSTAVAIAVIFAASACGTEQAPPAQSVTVEHQAPARHMNRPNPIDPEPAQTTAQPERKFMNGHGRPDSIG